MRDYGKVSPMFWIGKTGRALRGDLEAQVVAMYLMTSPHANMIGVYHCPIAYIAHETGLPIEGASKGLRRLIEADFCTYFDDTEVVWVHEMAKYQIGEQLKREDKRCIGIVRELDSVPESGARTAFAQKYGMAFHLPGYDDDDKGHRRPSKAPPKPGAGTGARTRSSLSGKPDDPGAPASDDGTRDPPVVDPDSPAGLLAYLNERTGKGFRAVEANVRLLEARLKSATPEQVRAVIDDRCAAWASDDRMADYLRPATLFGAQKFEQYLGKLGGRSADGNDPNAWRRNPLFADVVAQ